MQKAEKKMERAEERSFTWLNTPGSGRRSSPDRHFFLANKMNSAPPTMVRPGIGTPMISW